MKYHEQPYHLRKMVGGAPAEKKLIEMYEGKLERFGFDNSELNISKLPAVVRHRPDFITETCLIECKGIGRDQTLKLKLAEYVAMHWWHSVMDVVLFVWDSSKKRYAYVPFPAIRAWCERTDTVEQFHEGNTYFPIPAEVLFS